VDGHTNSRISSVIRELAQIREFDGTMLTNSRIHGIREFDLTDEIKAGEARYDYC
jgi:hypothetical protein